jgi:RNA polymerase sigma-32 factor
MLKHLLDNWSLIRFTTSNARRKVFFNLRREQERLRLQGIKPEPALIARRLDVPVEDVIDVAKAMDQREVSLDAPVSVDREATALDFVRAKDPPPDEQAADREAREILEAQFARFEAGLPERERAIFRERLAAEDPLTLQELADRFAMTREGMRLVEKRVVARFRDYMEREMAGSEVSVSSRRGGASR